MSENANVGGVSSENETPKPTSLVTKLAEVMAAVDRVPKRGRNDFHKYDYAMEADIVATVRKELARRHVMLVPAVSEVKREPVGEKGSALTTIDMTFSFIDGDSGERLDFGWFGCGTDKEDKGLYKAMTGAEKYFLLKTFLIPTGDDPEATPRNRGQQRREEPSDNIVRQEGDTRKITPEMAARLRGLMETHNTNGAQFKKELKQRFNYSKAEDIERRHYDFICRAVTEGVQLSELQAAS